MTRDFIVGIIFILSLVFLGALTILVSGIPSGPNDLVLEVGFEDVSGLKPGESVRIRGLRAGSVEQISLDQTRGLAVARVRLWEPLPPRDGYSFKVMAASALGGSYLKYIPGSGTPVDTEHLIGTASGDLFGEVGSMLAENRVAIKKSLDNLHQLLDRLKAGDGVIGALITDNTIQTQMKALVKNALSFTEDVKNGRGIVGSLMKQDSPQQLQVNQLLSTLLSDYVQFSEGPGMALKDADNLQKINDIISHIDTTTAALATTDGLAGRLIHDEALVQNWLDITTDLKSAAAQLSPTGKGALRVLLHDEELRDGLKTAISAIASISEAIEKGPGTLHSLINNPELYLEARETLTLLRDSTEDLREQEPVTAFFSILFAPF